MYLNNNWVADLELMHAKYKATDWVDEKINKEDYNTLDKFLAHRIDFLEEEVTETVNAYGNGDYREAVPQRSGHKGCCLARANDGDGEQFTKGIQTWIAIATQNQGIPALLLQFQGPLSRGRDR